MQKKSSDKNLYFYFYAAAKMPCILAGERNCSGGTVHLLFVIIFHKNNYDSLGCVGTAHLETFALHNINSVYLNW